MTHLHIDHVDGLSELAGCEILVNEAEWAHPSGAPKASLAPLKPKCFAFRPKGDAIFGRAFPITRAGNVIAVPTPAIRRTTVQLSCHGTVSPTFPRGRLKAYAQNNPTVLLPMLDPGAARRLAENKIVPQ